MQIVSITVAVRANLEEDSTRVSFQATNPLVINKLQHLETTLLGQIKECKTELGQATHPLNSITTSLESRLVLCQQIWVLWVKTSL
jgi:hypothetical protein